MFNVLCVMFSILCFMFYGLRFMCYVLCFLFYVLCFMLYGLCFMIYVLYFMVYVLCFVFYVLWFIVVYLKIAPEVRNIVVYLKIAPGGPKYRCVSKNCSGYPNKQENAETTGEPRNNGGTRPQIHFSSDTHSTGPYRIEQHPYS